MARTRSGNAVAMMDALAASVRRICARATGVSPICFASFSIWSPAFAITSMSLFRRKPVCVSSRVRVAAGCDR